MRIDFLAGFMVIDRGNLDDKLCDGTAFRLGSERMPLTEHLL
jgi:hypothetical protein